jgi:hypothetical protein
VASRTLSFRTKEPGSTSVTLPNQNALAPKSCYLVRSPVVSMPGCFPPSTFLIETSRSCKLGMGLATGWSPCGVVSAVQERGNEISVEPRSPDSLRAAACLVRVPEWRYLAVVSRSDWARDSWTVRMPTPLPMR